MKRKELIKRCLLALCLSVSLVSSSVAVCYGAPGNGIMRNETEASVGATSEKDGQDDTEQDAQGIVEIGSLEEFLELVENCNYDYWSLGKTVSLTTDLDLSGVDFDGIAYFDGVFEGNGHEISNVKIDPKGSDYGFFRFVGEKGEVKDLHVSGTVKPTGSQENIGGLAGVNYGTITGCSFKGEVGGLDSVGAVVGFNRSTGKIVSCSSEGIVLATNYTGGIVGTNEGLVSGCVNKSSINMEELEPTLDLGGMDLSSLNLTQNVVNRNDMGGIVGYSTGVIMDCKNEGVVGYKHTGYNVGGIVGSQSGIVLTSTNEGTVYGRKDVGGIVGQAEPYVESEYLEDKVRQTQDDMNRLSRTLNNISSTMSSTSAEVKQYTENLNSQYNTSKENISGKVDALKASVDSNNSKAQQLVDNIDQAWDRIDEIQSSGGILTEEQINEIQNHLGTIDNNLSNLQGSQDVSVQSAEELKNSITSQVQNDERTQDIKNLAKTVDNGVQSVANSMKSAVNQLNNITDSISNDLSVITGDEEVIEDISSLETAENTDGVISGCVNYGEINGDLNVGGIAGAMNIEYDGDPEFDLDLTDSLNVTLRSTVNNVMIHCINYGTVIAKKNCAGGIAGLQELGFIYDCEGYGSVRADAGSYLGGIVGDSAATIEKSYSLCNISGIDYVGGICGNGYSVKDSVSVSDIEGSGERVGSIAGNLEREGTVKGNVFVSDEIHGIDNISYAGVADWVSYEEVMEKEDIPEGFKLVDITFETEDGVLAETQIAYGGSIAVEDFPEVPEKEGTYIQWPESQSLTNVRKNLTVTAEYVPWVESVASTEETENGKPIFLVEGEFYKNTTLTLKEVAGPEQLDSEAVLAYAYSWELSNEKEKTFETLEGHFVVPEGAESASVWVKKDGTWTEAAVTADGSYLVAELPYGAEFAVVTQPVKDNSYVMLGGVVLLLAAAIILWRYQKKKKGKTAGKK